MSGRPTVTLRRPSDSAAKPALPACPNPECVAAHKRYPKGGHISMPDVHEAHWGAIPGSIARCYHCGGYWDGQKWTHKCNGCLKDVGPNDLRGMWVPHSCEPCENADIEAQKARGAICSKCGRVMSYCYC